MRDHSKETLKLPHDIFVAERRSADLRHQGLWNDETILDYFDAAVRQRPEHTAVVDYKSTTGLREALTYEQLAQRVEGISAAFAQRGIKAGDVISIQLPNWWEFTAIHLAAMRLGAVTNPLMLIFRARELSFMLELAESRILVAPRERESSRICLRSDGAPPPDRAGRGSITAIAIETFAPPMGVFKRGRDFAACSGLRPGNTRPEAMRFSGGFRRWGSATFASS
jgi:non-ribosomal peptide synthetase component F